MALIVVGHDKVNGGFGSGCVGGVHGEQSLHHNVVGGDLDFLVGRRSQPQTSDNVDALRQHHIQIMVHLDADTTGNLRFVLGCEIHGCP